MCKIGGKWRKRRTAHPPNVLSIALFQKCYLKEHYLDQARLDAKGHETLAFLISGHLQVPADQTLFPEGAIQTLCLTGA